MNFRENITRNFTFILCTIFVILLLLVFFKPRSNEKKEYASTHYFTYIYVNVTMSGLHIGSGRDWTYSLDNKNGSWVAHSGEHFLIPSELGKADWRWSSNKYKFPSTEHVDTMIVEDMSFPEQIQKQIDGPDIGFNGYKIEKDNDNKQNEIY